MEKINSMILAGDKKASKLINNTNKAFLRLKGIPFLVYVIRALRASALIDKIVIIGPVKEIYKTLSEYGYNEEDRIIVIKQKQNLLENGKAGFMATFTNLSPDVSFEDLKKTPAAEKCVMAVTCDIPLITTWEIDEFIKNADMVNYDYALGMSFSEVLTVYAPKNDNPGFEMTYFHMKEGGIRQNNLHLGKPLKLKGLVYIEKMYELRYQTHLINILLMVIELLTSRKRIFRSLVYFLRFQTARTCYNRKWNKLYKRFTRFLPMKRVYRLMSLFVGARLIGVPTSYGGAILDVDNLQDYETIKVMCDKWMQIQKDLHQQKNDKIKKKKE